MAESDGSLKEFHLSTAPPKTPKTGGMDSDSLGKHKVSNKTTSQLRPPSVIAKQHTKQEDKSDVKSLEERCERAKLLREKQIEERKKKNNERKAAVEERKRQKEDSVKNDSLRNLLAPKGTSGSRGVGTGRKLPNVPADGCYSRRESLTLRRSSTGSSSEDSPSHTPPGSARETKTSRRDLTGPSSASTSCLSNIGNGHVQSRTKSNMSKKTSASTNNLSDNTLSAKPASKVKEKSPISKSLKESGPLKAQSTSAIHQVGSARQSRQSPNKKTKSKANPSYHAGTNNPEDAKKALAEHRRKIREEAERQALLDKEKQEELRKQKEEEEKRLAEENAKETARQEELANLLKEQEEGRAKVLREEREKEEAERIEAETRRKEEVEMLKKQELERRAKEVEKREKEEEERMKREEEERQERRKRVEIIMIRTRMTAVATNNNSKSENDMPEDLAVKAAEEYQSSTVLEILQKVKARSREASPIPGQDAEKHNENQEKEIVDSRNDNGMTELQRINDTSKFGSLISEDKDVENDSSNIVSLSLRRHNGKGVTAARDAEVDGGIIGTQSNLITSTTNVNVAKQHNGELWENVENVMESSESDARDNLERNGAIAEDEDDEDGEEGQLWKVVEGKREFSDVV